MARRVQNPDMTSSPFALPTSVAYRFARDASTPTGFMSAQRPSTDAMNVLALWENSSLGRSYEVVTDEDDFLVARLNFVGPDREGAADALNVLCMKFGVKREPVESPR